MKNDEREATWHYHQGTKHPGGNLLDPYHRFSARDRPFLFKEYETLEPIPLPLNKTAVTMPALEAIAATVKESEGEQVPDLETVARLLYYSAGITKRIDYGPPVGQIAFRAASCTGALYHVELYLVCGDLPGLAAGIYHFDPRQNALKRLRQGDYRAHLVEATAGAQAVAQAPLVFVYSSVFWRNAVKYQARAYRHAFWDSGTILSHSLALSAAHKLPAQVVLGFVDEAVNMLLGLDGEWEAALALLTVGHTEAAPPPAPDLEPLSLEVKPILTDGRQRAQRILQPILTMHNASSLVEAEQVARWRGEPPPLPLPEPSGRLFPLETPLQIEMADARLTRVIERRGSSRRFQRKPISRRQLATILQQAVHGFPADFTTPSSLSLCHVYLIVSDVDGLPAGAYLYHSDRQALELLREGNFRKEAGGLALGQALGHDASANVYFLTDLEPVLDRFGNRGYRAAQLEASAVAGRIYLGAYAQELGASGLTFYDDGVVDFFSGQGASPGRGKSVLFLVAVGQPAPRR